MNLIERFNRSWLVFRTSCRVMRSNPKLLLFPVVSNLATLVIAAFFLLIPLMSLLLVDTGHSAFSAEHWQVLGRKDFNGSLAEQYGPVVFFLGVGSYAVLVYLTSMFIAAFCNTAFYQQIMKALGGEPVSIREGLRFASTRIKAILLWSLLSGTVGLLIKSIAERFGILGNIIMRFVGFAWSAASVFVIPIIVRENTVNPFTSLKNSVALLRRSWGEALIGYTGITMITTAAILFTLFPIGICIILLAVFNFSTGLAILIPFVLILELLFILLVGFLSNIANDIYRCSLYVYASEGVIPEHFTKDMMDAAWKVKKA